MTNREEASILIKPSRYNKTPVSYFSASKEWSGWWMVRWMTMTPDEGRAVNDSGRPPQASLGKPPRSRRKEPQRELKSRAHTITSSEGVLTTPTSKHINNVGRTFRSRVGRPARRAGRPVG